MTYNKEVREIVEILEEAQKAAGSIEEMTEREIRLYTALVQIETLVFRMED